MSALGVPLGSFGHAPRHESLLVKEEEQAQRQRTAALQQAAAALKPLDLDA